VNAVAVAETMMMCMHVLHCYYCCCFSGYVVVVVD